MSGRPCHSLCNTKEKHATHIITTVSEYFLTQKVKDVAPHADNYGEYLEMLAMCVHG